MLRFLFLLYMLNLTANKQHSISHFFLLPVTRQIFYKRYVCDIGQRVAYSADWADLTRTNRRLEVADSGDLEPIARELPSNDLFKTRIRVTFGSAKAVTITVY